MKFVFFSGVSWNSCIGGRTVHLAWELSKYHEVHFVEMPSLRNWRIGTRREANVMIHTLVPKADCWAVGLSAVSLSRRIGLSTAHLIVSHPAWAPLIRKVSYATLIYDYLDHPAVHTPGGRNFYRFAKADQMLLEQADLVFAVSQTLKERLRLSKCHFLPNGIPAELLAEALPSLPITKSIGFHGALYEWVDYTLLEAIADEFPEYQLRLAGPIRDERNLCRLRQKRNVVWTPHFHFRELSGIIGNFTIGVIPFLENDVGLCSDPLKTYEYLALGRAVVSTVPSAVKTSAFCRVSRGHFCATLRKVLSELPAADVCREAVRSHTWAQRAARLLEVIQEGAPRHAE